MGVLVMVLIFLGYVMYSTGFLSHPTPVADRGYDLASLQMEAPPSPFPQEEEAVIIEESDTEVVVPVQKVLFEYVEITDSCGPHFEGTCLVVRSGPGTDYPVVAQLRNGIVLKVAGKIEREGGVWYRIVFDEWLRYPERIQDDWYIAAAYARILLDEGLRVIDATTTRAAASSTKRIVVNRTTQTLYAYEGDTVVMEEDISTGLELTPTPGGTFTIFRKTPSRYMQGPIPEVSDQYYDLPGVPWNLYFTHGGAVIHGAYWHTSFGTKYSHGCVNLPPEVARELYYWADLGTKVVVTD